MNDVYKVVTPENIELNYEIAGIGSRFLAIAIDVTIQWLLILGILSSLDMLKLSTLQSKITHLSTSLAGALIIGMLFIILIGYYVILETVMNGQTIGKKLVNIRVRKEGGYAPSFWDILLRNIVRMADFLPSFYGLGLLVMFINKRSKRLGDYAAGTIVVKELSRHKINKFLTDQDAAIAVPIKESTIISEKYPWLHAMLPNLTQADYLLMKNLYSRRNELTNIQLLALVLVNKTISRNNADETLSINDNDALTVLTEIIALYENINGYNNPV
jgi:uncharacterized RDD family membrane protein YckC